MLLAIRAGQRTWEDGIQTLVAANPAALHSAKLHKAYPEGLALVGGAGHPAARTMKVEHNNKEGGLRLFQNLYLLALHNRNAHGEGKNGRRGATRKPRKHRSWNSSSHGCSGSRKTADSHPNNKTIPLNPRTLTIMYQLLRSKPDIVDPDSYYNSMTMDSDKHKS